MKVRVFAALRELVGATHLEVEARDVGALLDALSAQYGEPFTRIMAAGTVVVNGETVDRGRQLNVNDEIALLPPVSGGRRA